LQQVKIAFCVYGSIFDVALDLRRGSPAYGRHVVLKLSAEDANMVYLGPGIAHGFYVLSREAVVCYRVSTPYSPAHDQGVRWDSAGINWPAATPIVSQRDQDLPAFADFETPFVFGQEHQINGWGEQARVSDWSDRLRRI
jgi:dTDP-4-dehydrorhamnose 3,5-epimerase